MASKKTQRAQRAPSVPHAGNIAQFTLDNGIRVFVYENFNSPAVVINGFLFAGAIDEPKDKAGLAGFVTDCLMRGTKDYSYRQIFEYTEDAGATLSVSGNVFTTSVFAKSLSEDLPLMLKMIASLLRRPTFPKAELEKERAEWLTSLQERANSTRAMANLAFYELAYPERHPYHRSSDGYVETVKTFTRDDVAAFHKRAYQPTDMALVIVGAVRAEEAHKLIAAHLGDWHGARVERAEVTPAPKIDGVRERHITMAGKSQSTVLLGYPSISHLDPDWMACAQMNSILGQFGMYGRLGESVRKEEGLVYYIGTRFDGGSVPGPWTMNAGTNPATINRVLQIVREEMRRIRDKKVKPGELEDNQRYFTGVMPLQLETNEGIAGQITNMVRYKRPLDFLLTYPDRVRAVTIADVQRVAQRWLDPDNYVLVTAGPAAPAG
jgi:zinc protease